MKYPDPIRIVDKYSLPTHGNTMLWYNKHKKQWEQGHVMRGCLPGDIIDWIYIAHNGGYCPIENYTHYIPLPPDPTD